MNCMLSLSAQFSSHSRISLIFIVHSCKKTEAAGNTIYNFILIFHFLRI
ncbi:unnamed protein product [Amoebophrya sp. A25]|nr:unnamed protein product [Amoebophrya sp. A25]|eukprot:GSA25T00003884001.1